jgi:hypothetical protein
MKRSPWLQAMEDAHCCEVALDWPGAEQAYKRAVQVTTREPMLQYKACSQLSALYGLLDRKAEALTMAQVASSSARDSNMPPLLSIALQAEAELWLGAGNSSEAWRAINEALKVVEEGPTQNLERARALIVRGSCFRQEGDWPCVRADLAAAWSLLEAKSPMSYGPGWQAGLAKWWAVTASLRSVEGDLSGALLAWHETVAQRRLIARAPQLEGPYKWNALATALRDLTLALRVVGDEPAAAEAFRESCSIRRGIGLPPLDEARA